MEVHAVTSAVERNRILWGLLAAAVVVLSTASAEAQQRSPQREIRYPGLPAAHPANRLRTSTDAQSHQAQPIAYQEAEPTLADPQSEELPPADDKSANDKPANDKPDDTDASSETSPTETWIDPALDYDEPAPVCSSGSWLNNGIWYTQLDAVYLHQSGPEGRLIAIDTQVRDNFNGNFPQLRTPNGENWSPGARLTIGRFLGRDYKNRDHALEFTFMGLENFSNEVGLKSVTDNGIDNVLDPFRAGGGFSNADQQTITSSSKLTTFELNYRLSRRLSYDKMELNRDGEWVRKCNPTLLPAFIAGFRYLAIEEQAQYLSQGNDKVHDLLPISGRYNISTHNHLIGLQTGTDIFYQRSNWRVGARGKVGAMVNFADEDTNVHVVTFVPRADRHEKDTTNCGAFVGEINLMLAYQIAPNMAIRGSMDLMWVNQVALAFDQFNFNPPPVPTIVTGGVNFYQGGSLGFEYVW